jgi:drug/metabolite transporter (DMT)-like permease
MYKHKSSISNGQEPIGPGSIVWLSFLTFLWSFNSVAIKIIVADTPPFFAAFLRFAPSVILIGLFLAKHSAAKVSVFFFVTPILGIFISMLFLNERFDLCLLAGALLVGCGIALGLWKGK